MRRPRRRTSGITQDGILRLSLERSIETPGKREKGNGKLAVDHRDDRKQPRKILEIPRVSERSIRPTFLLKASECPFGSMTSASEISHPMLLCRLIFVQRLFTPGTHPGRLIGLVRR